MPVIAFNTEQITEIATATQAHRAEWDSIWNAVKTKLGSVVGEALDAATGCSLEDRTTSYHQKSDLYAQQLLARAQATSTIGQIAEETGAAMIKTLTG